MPSVFAPSGGAVGNAATSPNFSFLATVEPSLVQLAARAERYVFDDPVVSLVKTRQFGEVLAQQVAAHTGMYASPAEQQVDLLRRLRDRRVIDGEVADFFHSIRVAGNKAVHENYGNQRDALRQLRMAWSLAVWFRRAFKERGFKPGPFVPPPDPVDVEKALAAELAELRASLAEHAAKSEQLAATAEDLAQQRAAAERAAQTAYADLEIALDLAQETESQAAADKAQLEAQLAALQAAAEAAPKPEAAAVLAQVQHAGEHFLHDEATTRLAIDAQLTAAGWDADSAAISYKAGTRPTKGRNLAIAEWPTASGPADYVLFAGLTPLAVVEAKRRAKDVAGAIDQSKRYARDYVFREGERSPGGPWDAYAIPFLFATNGRGFIQQLRTKSGIWFLDARRATNLPRPLGGWYTPDDLTALLAQDIAAADHKLATEPADYLPLRDYQRAAIAAVESAIAAGRQNMLLAMATGTGKTRLALCLIYRLLKAGRFRRVLFLVDRTALGEQAHNAFKDVRLDQLQPLTEIYDVKGLGDLRPDPDTRLHVATVQGMVHRLLNPDGDTPPPAVGAYDCILIDECHRGYSLDREMTEGELEFRSEADYISKYRRVLDHFDATRIGLTATPALHTTEIFGKPIYEYGYRQAVIDGYLVDHEPPIRLLTKLNQQGIHWEVGESVNVYDPGTGQLQLFETPDEIDIEVDGFNTKVVTEPFNRVICQALAAEIDPTLPGKTMVFCATDAHADMVVDLLKQAFNEAYGAVEDAAVQKITGATDKPLEHLRRFKNERLPNVAVTVDLLTTGIDVPAITNLVFIRRVRSRILYEQMMGRATRLCADLYGPGADKEFFRIYDTVDLYSALLPYSAMKPVVVRPNITFDQLATELLTTPDDDHKRTVLDEFIAKLQRKKRRIEGQTRESFETLTGMSPESLIALLKPQDLGLAVDFFTKHPGVASFLDGIPGAGGKPILVSEHPDALIGTEVGYGTATKPEDYLAGFKAFIDANQNALAALTLVTQRPRDLTRTQLRELRLQLDAAGYPESTVRKAWAAVSNQDIAASIIGFIRQQALGSPLLPYDQRVDRAMQRVLALKPWTPPQRQWLDRIGKQLKAELIVDREALDRGQFKAQGGFNRINKVFEGQLEQLLGTLHEELWKDTA
ncbi:MAG: type I restriction-modification system endonuclease [Myxococcota bacterium]